MGQGTAVGLRGGGDLKLVLWDTCSRYHHVTIQATLLANKNRVDLVYRSLDLDTRD